MLKNYCAFTVSVIVMIFSLIKLYDRVPAIGREMVLINSNKISFCEKKRRSCRQRNFMGQKNDKIAS